MGWPFGNSKSSSKNTTNNVNETLAQYNDGDAYANLGDGNLSVQTTDFGAVQQAFDLGKDAISDGFDALNNSNEIVYDISANALDGFGQLADRSIDSLITGQDQAFKFGERLYMDSSANLVGTQDKAFDFVGDLLSQSNKSTSEAFGSSLAAVTKSTQSEASQQIGDIIGLVQKLGIAAVVAFGISRVLK